MNNLPVRIAHLWISFVNTLAITAILLILLAEVYGYYRRNMNHVGNQLQNRCLIGIKTKRSRQVALLNNLERIGLQKILLQFGLALLPWLLYLSSLHRSLLSSEWICNCMRSLLLDGLRRQLAITYLLRYTLPGLSPFARFTSRLRGTSLVSRPWVKAPRPW